MASTSYKLAVFAFAAAAGVFAAFSAYRTMSDGAPTGYARARLGAAPVHVNRAYLHSEDFGEGESVEQIDVDASYPDFLPVAANPRQTDSVFHLRLHAQDTSIDPSERPASLYARFLEMDRWTNPGGLYMRRFEPGSPYEREELYYAPPEGRLFWARCTRQTQPPDGLPSTCISEVRVNGLDVQLRFAPELLPEWERLSAGVRGLVENFTR